MKTKINIFRGDKVIWVVFFLLSVISLIAVYTSLGSMSGMFLKHTVIVLATYIAIIALSFINYRSYSRIALLGYVGSVVLLALTAVLIWINDGGSGGSGTGRWLRIGNSFQMQPSEIAKIALIIFTARILTIKKDVVATKEFFWQILIYVGIVVVFVIPEGFSNAALIFLICYLVMFLGGVNRKRWWLMFAAMLMVVCIFMGMQYTKYKHKVEASIETNDPNIIARSDTWGHRIYSWINNNPDDYTQENTARMAVARGGLFGSGVGNTIFSRLTKEAYNDFIYAIIIEETGLIMGLVIFILYAILYLRCIRLAKRCQGRFGKLTVAGLGTAIYIQALLNMGVAVGALPVTGQTLPFISYGGTAYLFTGCGLGVIQAVAADVNKAAKKTSNTGEVQEPETDIEPSETENQEL